MRTPILRPNVSCAPTPPPRKTWNVSRFTPPIVVSEPNPARRAIAERWGADLVVDPTTDDVPKAVKSVTEGYGAEWNFPTTPTPPRNERDIITSQY